MTRSLLTSTQRAFLAFSSLSLLAIQIPSCGGSGTNPPADVAVGGTGPNGTGGTGPNGTGGTVSTDPAGGTQSGDTATGGTTQSNGDTTGGAGLGGTTAGGATSQFVVSLVQSSAANASDISQEEISTMVSDAITQAGGFDFIRDGMTVVLKPNLLTHLSACWNGTATLPATVNGVTTDWRVTKAVADLVRARNATGQILVMEGSNRNTMTAFAVLGYTTENFGGSVDAFIPLEGTSGCADRSQTGLVQKSGATGKQYWVNEQYFNADIVISIGALKTHGNAGITGCVKNLGIGATPNAMYSISNDNTDCTRNMFQASASSYIDHGTAAIGDFVADFYSVRPADFAVMDGLQGLQNGPCNANASDRMNMRLILASKNAVALDTVEALIMSCDPKKVTSLTKAESYGLGTTDSAQITIVGNKQIADVKTSFKSGVSGVCN